MSYSAEIDVAWVYRKLLKRYSEDTLDRKVLLVLFENQLCRIDKDFRPKQVSDSHGKLLDFMQRSNIRQEAINARADLDEMLAGPPAVKRKVAQLLQQFERQAAWKRSTGIPPIDEWKPVPGGAPESKRSTH